MNVKRAAHKPPSSPKRKAAEPPQKKSKPEEVAKKQKTEQKASITKAITSKNGSPHLPPADAPIKPVKFLNGLQYTTVRAGKGMSAFAGAKVKVHYVGKLSSSGKVFDKTNKQPFPFKLGAGEVIKGWDLGVKGMKVGEKRILQIPAQLGYGKRGAAGAIPPNAALTFDVEMCSFT
eukprot:TRINITY_DN11597_c0_g1_i4.p1 TRINITY_DN11597_c0_g1~~TRINITY_DN11597_c0_g1_i4.p1  ORF type:complete len:176 (+),score=48.22 TRINITY_DN11597_c0_g1_i4:288-815(+)